MNDPFSSLEFFEKLSDKFFWRIGIDLIFITILVRFIYFRIYHKKDYLFTFYIFNIIIYIITYLLSKVDLSMGAAFGLFAVFSMLRYRTEGISTKEMTYLLLVIAIGLISALFKGTYFELCLLNFILLAATYLLDGNWLARNELIKTVIYENIELTKAEYRKALIDDLRARTGLNIHRISIVKIDFMRDMAEIQIYYFDDNNKYIVKQ